VTSGARILGGHHEPAGSGSARCAVQSAPLDQAHPARAKARPGEPTSTDRIAGCRSRAPADPGSGAGRLRQDDAGGRLAGNPGRPKAERGLAGSR
jgi:hypothetical protein